MAVLDELLVRLGVDMSDAEGEIDRGAQGIENRLNGLTAAGGVAAAGLGAAFVTGLEAAMDISSVQTQLQNQLALTDEEAARAGSIAGDVFSAGFGESLGDVGEALDSVASSMHEFGSISDAEMTQLTKDALALSKTFQFDVGEAAVGAGNLIKAGLAKDGTEAMDLMAAAAQRMPKAMREELPAVTKEYSEFFAQLGATGPEMMGALAEASKNPLFEIDKLGDAVKEFTLRIADTEAVAEPLKELGLDVGEIQALVNKGQGTKAFDEITKALAGVENQTDRTRIAAALMGGPGEDAQASLKAFGEAGGFAGNKLKDVAGAAKEVADNMEASPAQQWDSIMRTVSTTLGEMLLPVLTFVSDLFKEHPGLLKVLIPVVLALAAALAVAAAAQWAMNSALLANPITLVVLLIIALVTWLVVLWKRSETFRNIVLGVWNAIKFGITVAVAAVKAAVQAGMRGVLAAVGWLRALPGRVAAYFTSLKDRAVRKTLELITWVRGLPGRLLKALGNLNRLLVSAGQDLIRGMINGIRNMAGNLVGAAKRVVSSAIDGAKNLLGISSPSKVFRDIGIDTGRGLVEGLRSSRPAVEGAAEEMASSVQDAFKGADAAGGMDAAVGELRRLVESGDFSKQGSLLFEDVSFQGMSKNFSKFQGEIADGFWNAVFEIEKAIKAGKQVFEDFTFQGMSRDVERFGSSIAKLFHSSAVARGTSTATSAFRAKDLFPGLADGAVVTGPTVAMVGEGGEDEAVLPLSKLEHLLDMPSRMAGRVQQAGGRWEVEVIGPRDFKALIRRITQTNARGGDANELYSTT